MAGRRLVAVVAALGAGLGATVGPLSPATAASSVPALITTLRPAGAVSYLAADPGLHRVYTANFQNTAGSIGVVDTTTERLVANWRVPSGLEGLAVDLGTHQVYVTADDGSLRVFGSGGRQLARVTVGRTPLDVALDPAQHLAYIPLFDARQVVVLDTRTLRVVRRIGVDMQPESVTLDLARHIAYVPGIRDLTRQLFQGTLVALDLRTNRIAWRIGVGLQPIRAAINRATNTIWTANFTSADVTIVNGSTHRRVRTVRVGREPVEVRFDRGGRRAYVSQYQSGTVAVLEAVSFARLGSVAVGTGPGPMLVDGAAHRLYVGSLTTASLTVLALRR